MITSLCLLFFLFLAAPSVAFSPFKVPSPSVQGPSSSALYGLLEWREVRATSEVTPLLLLPYSESDILLPGQACQIVLKEGRHFDMVEDALEDHQSIIGQAMMGQDKLASTLSLCHITDTDVHSEYRGKITMTVSLESVGRASLEELLTLKPVPLGYCSELLEDWSNQELDELKSLQSQIETILLELDDLSPNDKTGAFRTRYEGAMQSLRRQNNADLNVERASFEASSWAVFAALSAIDNSFEPRRALESPTAEDRLRYGLQQAQEIRGTKRRQADQYSLLDDGVFE